MYKTEGQRKQSAADSSPVCAETEGSKDATPTPGGDNHTMNAEGSHSGPRDGRKGKGAPVLDEARIMARVKGFYQEMLEAPVPEEFIRLIQALEKKEENG